jgi:subfamily B ATP-binding cassette protein MsbA
LHSVRWQAALAGALMAINPLVAVLLLWLMKYLIDEVFVGKNVGVLPIVASAYTILVATKLAIDYLLTRIEAAIAEQIDQNVRVDVYRHLVSVSPGSLRKYSVGDLISHLGADVSRVEGLIYGGPVRVIFSTLTAVYFIGFLFVLSWKLTLAALITAPVLALLSWRWSPYVRRVARISRRKATAWISRAEERLGATAVIIAFGAQSLEAQAFEAQCRASRLAALRSVALQAWLTLVTEAVAATGGFVVLAVGAYEMYSDALTVGTLIAFLGSVGSLYSPISSLARSPGRFQRSAVGAQRIVELLDAPSLVTERHDAIPLKAVRGVLEFSGVCFAYPDGPEALRGVSFRIDAGETVAVVGPNGSGKTTLVQLALRLYDPSEGLVSIDGMDLRGVTLESLRRSVAVVFQEPSVLRGNISETIRYGQPDASNEMFISTAKAAHVHEFATGLPRGYGTPIGPRGSWLSGGQRQRLALARALLRDSPILLLDEATASIDSEAEQLIQEAVSRFRGKRTIMVVSHRLSTVLRADRIVLLENGRIVEIGTPAALQGSASRFRTLFADQFLTEKVPA